MKKFRIVVISDCVLTEKELFPDGDIPENLTGKDVLDKIMKVGMYRVVKDWNLPIEVKVREEDD